ncbi:nicotinate-nucleotide pyrophosphorylase [carboxylating]-like [Saccoglossus kowalevskii]|uniref:Nicotinate-nucleotide pyrophosphorylase [carboxylating] n=1 Tax=Saccoglossus kowalevskii TaxID=10224 RepID=A0ABM0M0H7_SACKO|nr:PREDICTED: nicotinate-nucleotide pyrophosphorylase [carboxylating]-like isoform X1 [Saccoglossus kowalevskii]XP_006813518.1 PREDICTED: nicotinate-nucleotide pyrophosphorylase [carboxylating]-like isoform X2 [Saccoglossus kowalevskii]
MSSVTGYKPQISHLIHPTNLKTLVRQWLNEDTPSFDYSGFVVGERQESAVLLCKSPGVLAGVPFFTAIFEELDCNIEWLVEEGSLLEPVCQIAIITGKVKNLLLGERVALNCITRASGIASYARQMNTIAKHAEWHGEVAGTRKTTPGFRLVEKYSLLVGGMSTHRYDLSSMIMLKDNHIWTAGNISQAVKDAKKVGGFSTKIEVECRSVSEATEAATAGCDIVMLDNFTPQAVHVAAKQLKDKFPYLIIEASGGINEENITQYMGTNIDVLSIGKSTQGYNTVDFSFKIQKEGRNPHNPTVSNPNKST